MSPTTFHREAGAPGAPGVVCIHANASSSSQWRGLMALMAPTHHVLAADSLGAGKGPPWPADRAVTLADEAALLEPVFARAGEPFALVGHSYGGAVALIAALARPQRVRALVLYEPTLFALVDAAGPPPNEADGIRSAVAAATTALARGDGDDAARRFIDYWMGDGAWAATPPARKPPIVDAVSQVGGWARALFGEPTPLAAFAALKMPVLCLVGGASPVAGRAVTKRLLTVLPQAEVCELAGLGHMGPVTHPETVNPVIADFLRRHGAGAGTATSPSSTRHRPEPPSR